MSDEDSVNATGIAGRRNPSAQEHTVAELHALFDQHVATVHRYVVSRLGQDLAEEVVSEVFHAAAVAYRDGRGHQVTIAWLMATTRNKVIDQWRRAARRKAKDHLIRPRAEDLVTFPEHWHEDSRRPAVLAALERCDQRHRAVLILHYVDGMTAPEIAESLGVTTAAIESLLARARRAFRRHYRDPEDR